MVLQEPLHHRVRATLLSSSGGAATGGTTTGAGGSATPRRRVRSSSAAGSRMMSPANEGILLSIALLATIGLTALTISLGASVYAQHRHPTPAAPGDLADRLEEIKDRRRHKKTTSTHKSNKSEQRRMVSPTSTTTSAGGGSDDGHADDDDGKEVLPWNPLYRVPGSYETVGDRSDRYVLLRREVDAVLPPGDARRSLEFVRQLHGGRGQLPVMPDIAQSDAIPYDVYDCPATPPPNYPHAWNLVRDVLGRWPVNEMAVPGAIHQGLCVFDHARDREKAIAYRDAELPFVVVNDPQVAESAERWNQPRYVERMLSGVKHRTEYSENSHFMYYIPLSKKAQQKAAAQQSVRKNGRPPVVPKDWKEPTKLLRMTYTEWLAHANTSRPVLPDEEHWYYRLIGCGEEGPDCDTGSSEYLFDELPFFQPKPSLYIVDPDEQKGIHCRFGMSGVIAENHFDASRNAITVLSGSRRYILTHPNQCDKLALYPKGHPSARHSAVDWTNPDLVAYPQFGTALSNEVVLTAGQVLYLPTDWFHFIVSLELNFQCNTRSGITDHYKGDINRCGF